MDRKELAKCLKDGNVVIYAGSEGYEAACSISSKNGVERLIKASEGGIFSVIAPSKGWIYGNMHANKRYIERLPGPFTFLLMAKKGKMPAYALSNGIVGVRLASNDVAKVAVKNGILLFSHIIAKDGRLVLGVKQIPKTIKKAADFMIDDGLLDMKPHVVIDITGKVARIVR